MPSIKINNKSNTFPVPYAFADKYMPSANAVYVKVYIYALRLSFDTGYEITIESIASKLNILESDVINAFEYWKQVGIMEFKKTKLGYETEFLSCTDTENTADKKAHATPKYAAKDVTRCIQENDDMKNMYQIAQGILNRPLSTTEITTLYSMYDWLGLPREVVLMILEHCAQIGKTNMRYIEKVAVSWSEKGIDTLDKAKAHLRAAKEFNLVKTKIKNIFQIKDRNFTETELKYISKWINDMSVDIDMIKKAYDVTVTNTQKLSYPYMTTVLQSIVDGTFDKPKSKQAKGGFLNYTERKDLDENDLNMIKKRREYIAKGEA
ncbi:DnaD domain-containing protein [Qingrenia yutianensis]|uniref:DnaD domain protein n=1 Tax=Qingrenia yutianensis TaxID=2763676 RepID=A0A926F842_9FIRM|nr:DnaD domain protein [Qingrenia yutianensis]MBC8595988.1 DnaD domain protein [Qingrenia yutianensis]